MSHRHSASKANYTRVISPSKSDKMSRAQNQNTSTTRTESQDRSTFPSGQGGVQVLRLRGEPGEPEAPTTQRRRIRWAEDVVDNEGQGKKSSKGTCLGIEDG